MSTKTAFTNEPPGELPRPDAPGVDGLIALRSLFSARETMDRLERRAQQAGF